MNAKTLTFAFLILFSSLTAINSIFIYPLMISTFAGLLIVYTDLHFSKTKILELENKISDLDKKVSFSFMKK
jgi:cell division protein FtsL